MKNTFDGNLTNREKYIKRLEKEKQILKETLELEIANHKKTSEIKDEYIKLILDENKTLRLTIENFIAI